MTSELYEKQILEKLLKKYHKRLTTDSSSSRRILLRPKEILADYDSNHADLDEKELFGEAAEDLADRSFITLERIRFSNDIQKICLCTERLDRIYDFLQTRYGIVSPGKLALRVYSLLEQYGNNSHPLIRSYCAQISRQLEYPDPGLSPEKVENNLKMLSFLAGNRDDVYLREASMLVYGDSKWFENNNCTEICRIARSAMGQDCPDEDDDPEEVLEAFHVFLPEQDLSLKGPWILQWENRSLDISMYQGGLSLSSKDMTSLTRVIVPAGCLMTIENKTSYRRMELPETAMLYLGGFASRQQTGFLTRVLTDNPGISCLHFGDIDAGGFYIHRHLCRVTGRDFSLYRMGIRELSDERFAPCRKELTANDIRRLTPLLEEKPYAETVAYMLRHGVKLEQEVVSYRLMTGIYQLHLIAAEGSCLV